MRVPLSRLVLVAALLAVVAFASEPASAYNFGSNIRPLGPEETEFDWTTQRCEDIHVPDTPVRAYRDSNNQVVLTMSHYVNRRMIGPSLNDLSVDCDITYSSDGNADPAAYDDQEWIHSPWTSDGKNVFALVHDEYHGWDHPGQCTSQGHPNVPKLTTVPAPPQFGNYNPGCLYNSITLATSTDGGASYRHTTPPTHLVASVPYVYAQDTAPYGYFSPDNIIKRSDGYFYVIFFAQAHGAQLAGDCVMRTKTPTRPVTWRAWDGSGYNVQFINPYRNPQPPEQHVCAPVSYNELGQMIGNVTYNTFFGKYVMVGAQALVDPGSGDLIWGFYYSTSSDLVNWSMRELVMEAELPWTYECGDDSPVVYPALMPASSLTPTSTTRNFDTTGRNVFVYFTRMNPENCVLLLDRDLIRIPIQFINRESASDRSFAPARELSR